MLRLIRKYPHRINLLRQTYRKKFAISFYFETYVKISKFIFHFNFLMLFMEPRSGKNIKAIFQWRLLKGRIYYLIIHVGKSPLNIKKFSAKCYATYLLFHIFILECKTQEGGNVSYNKKNDVMEIWIISIAEKPGFSYILIPELIAYAFCSRVLHVKNAVTLTMKAWSFSLKSQMW